MLEINEWSQDRLKQRVESFLLFFILCASIKYMFVINHESKSLEHTHEGFN